MLDTVQWLILRYWKTWQIIHSAGSAFSKIAPMMLVRDAPISIFGADHRLPITKIMICRSPISANHSMAVEWDFFIYNLAEFAPFVEMKLTIN